MSVTVAERQHFRSSIEKRINEKIQALHRSDPTYKQRKASEARAAIVKELSLQKDIDETNKLVKEWRELGKKITRKRATMLAKVKGKTIEECENDYGCRPDRGDEDAAKWISSEVGEHIEGKINELMKKDKLGKEILRLQNEKSTINDAIWMATSPAALTELYQKAMTAIGEPAARSEIEKTSMEQGLRNA